MIFQLLVALVTLPLSIILAWYWYTTGKKVFGTLLGLFWLAIFVIYTGFAIVRVFKTKKELGKEDIYGEYIVDRTKFPGSQSDWQYNHFRFKIMPDNKFIFSETEKDSIVKTVQGMVTFLEGYKQPRIVIGVDTPGHYVIDPRPTLYRKPFSFYYVFHSQKVGNVFFTKGKWVPLDR
jgi:energy-coupling factor transporter transmembrane protein EcfT